MKILMMMMMILISLEAETQAANVLGAVNQRRARIGRPAFVAHQGLYRAAQAEANAMAKQGRSGHVYGSSSIKKYTRGFSKYGAGVGPGYGNDINGLRFNSCYASTTTFSYAGAATAVGSGGRTYYALMLAK